MTESAWKRWIREPRNSLLFSNGFAQVLLFGGMAGISRLYAPEPIGAWSTCLAFVQLIWSFSQLKTDVALIQTQQADEKKPLLYVGLVAHGIVSALCFLAAKAAGLFPNAQQLLFFSVLASHAVQQMYTAWYLSEHAYAQVNRMRLLHVLIAYPGSLLLCGVDGERGLLWALLAGNLLPALLSAFSSRRPASREQGFAWNGRLLIRKHLPTMSYLPLGNFLLSLSEQGMVLLVSVYYDAGTTAAFFLASRVCTLPLSFVQSAMSQYNLRYFQDLHNGGKFSSSVIVAYWKKWFPIGLAYFLPLLLAGPWLFGIVFGEAWASAGHLARLLSLAALLRFLSSPTSMGFLVIGQQRVFFLFTLAYAVLFGISVLLAWLRFPLGQLVGITVCCQLLFIFCYNGVMLRAVSYES